MGSEVISIDVTADLKSLILSNLHKYLKNPSLTSSASFTCTLQLPSTESPAKTEWKMKLKHHTDTTSVETSTSDAFCDCFHASRICAVSSGEGSIKVCVSICSADGRLLKSSFIAANIKFAKTTLTSSQVSSGPSTQSSPQVAGLIS